MFPDQMPEILGRELKSDVNEDQGFYRGLIKVDDDGGYKIPGSYSCSRWVKKVSSKNIRILNGHPLIAYTIAAAKSAKTLTDFIVSSDDNQIIKIAKRYGAPTPFKRPSELARDETRNNETLLHALEFMENARGYQYDIILLLQPTSPIRDYRHIDLAIAKLADAEQDTLASVKGPFKKRQPILKKIEQGVLKPIFDVFEEPRDGFYLYNAALYAVKRAHFYRTKTYFSEKQVPLPMDRLCSQDVDDVDDFQIVDMFMNNYGITLEEPHKDEYY